MNLKIVIAVIAIITVAGLGYMIFNTYEDNKTASQQSITQLEENTTAQNCVSDDCLKVENLEYPVDKLPDSVAQALYSALDDEYKAHATYAAVINTLGPIRPFSMIIRAEEQHISSLKALFDKYALSIPADPYANIMAASSKADNCAVGVQAEIDNASLYRDTLLPAVSNYPDITSVFTSLMNASQNNHLPAFERCAS